MAIPYPAPVTAVNAKTLTVNATSGAQAFLDFGGPSSSVYWLLEACCGGVLQDFQLQASNVATNVAVNYLNIYSMDRVPLVTDNSQTIRPNFPIGAWQGTTNEAMVPISTPLYIAPSRRLIVLVSVTNASASTFTNTSLYATIQYREIDVFGNVGYGG